MSAKNTSDAIAEIVADLRTFDPIGEDGKPIPACQAIGITLAEGREIVVDSTEVLADYCAECGWVCSCDGS